MPDYEQLIQHFFRHFNITITDKIKEQKNILSPHCYSVTYRVENFLKSRNNGLIIRFSFDEHDTILKSNISCSYEDSAVDVLQFDGAVLRDQIALGLKCMGFLDSEKIRHYCPLIEISAVMDKLTKKTSFKIFSHTINIFINRNQTERVNLLFRVNQLIDLQLNKLAIDTRDIDLNDKLDLLAMVKI
jgi:hypothetical protein